MLRIEGPSGPVGLHLRRQSGWRPISQLEILDGKLKAFDHLPQVAAAVWEADDRDGALASLTAEPLQFSEVQAIHVLSCRSSARPAAPADDSKRNGPRSSPGKTQGPVTARFPGRSGVRRSPLR